MNRILACSVVLVLAAGGCGGSSAPTAGPTAVPEAAAGGTIRVAIGPVVSLDPQLAVDPSAQLVVRTMCDQLIEFDPRTKQPAAGLAESWTVTSRGTRLILKLRKDATFSDGNEVTAEDVVLSLSRLASEELGSPAARVIEDISGFGFVHGDVETDRDELLTSLVGIQRIDSRTLEFTLDRPNAEFYKALTHPATTPLSLAEGEGEGLACSGPYVVQGTVESNGPISLERAARYSGGPTHTRSGRGYADRIVFVQSPDRNAGFETFVVSPDIDAALVPDGRLAEVAGSALKVEVPTEQLEIVGLSTSAPPFDDPKVRRAVALALDREAIASKVYSGGRSPAPSFLRFTEDRACGATKADAARAKAMLAEAGVDLAAPWRVYFNDEFSNRALVEEVAAQWRSALGATVETVPMSWETFITRGRGTGGFDGAFRFGWAPEYPSPERVLFPLFDTDSIGRDNLSRYSSAEFRESLRQARRQVDDRRRTAGYAEAQRLLCEDMPAIPIAFDNRTYLVRERIRPANGELMDEAWGEPNLREWFIAS